MHWPNGHKKLEKQKKIETHRFSNKRIETMCFANAKGKKNNLHWPNVRKKIEMHRFSNKTKRDHVLCERNSINTVYFEWKKFLSGRHCFVF